MERAALVDAIIEKSPFRRNIYTMIPEGASRILDVGCGDGGLLLRLQRDKGCTTLHGVEVNAPDSAPLHDLVDKLWAANIETDFEQFHEYEGYFRYIILHDVVEHLFDPWRTLGLIRTLLHEEGRLFLATPNIHFWRLQYKILSGFFPYGPGLWHTGHLRWFTPISLLELLVISGLSVGKLYLEIPHHVDLHALARVKTMKHFQVPPPEFQNTPEFPETFTLSYKRDIRKYIPVFHAHKILADCGKGEAFMEPKRMVYNCPQLEAIRAKLNLPFDIFNPPVMYPLVGEWC